LLKLIIYFNIFIKLFNLNKINEEDYNSLLYVGMSRARTGLFVFINKKYQQECLHLISQYRGIFDERDKKNTQG